MTWWAKGIVWFLAVGSVSFLIAVGVGLGFTERGK